MADLLMDNSTRNGDGLWSQSDNLEDQFVTNELLNSQYEVSFSRQESSEGNVAEGPPNTFRVLPVVTLDLPRPSPVGRGSALRDSSDSPGGYSPVHMRALTHGRTLTPSRAQDDESMEGQRGSPVFQGQRSRSDGKLTCVGVQEKHASKVSKRESLKAQKKNYRREKKRAAKELLHTLKDPSVVVMADWLKVRGSLKSWTKLWCSLKPGLLVLYKSHKEKSGHWVGTVLLSTCELIERPSKKDGFCFKLFHPLDQSIWAPKGPKGETIGAITQPLPYSYLIFRAPSEAAGKCWMDALELALRCSNLLMRTMTRDRDSVSEHPEVDAVEHESVQAAFTARDQMNESDVERHFKGVEIEDEGSRTDREEGIGDKSESETDPSDEEEEPELFDEDLQPVETPYQENQNEELGQQGDACQTEEIADENKSLIWTLVKQVRPGMDLSKVVLPTFILEPRSLLDKFSDYYYHADYITEAILQEDPYTRIKSVVRWYLSGFYKKPKGLKKPYNPILGETFRCYWKHPKTNSRTFFIAEQISHHPPVTAFFITNRKDGFCISGSVLAKSKFYGNSVSAIMDGGGRLSFLQRGEDYLITMPYAHCKGILIGTLTMELGGKVSIECEKTGYRADLEFKLKPFLGSGEASNRFVGKIKLGSETLSTLDGHWDQAVYLKDKKTGESTLFWDPTPEVKRNRLLRYTVPLDQQKDNESEKLWVHVSKAVLMGDQEIATKEKHILEEIQRKGARERKAKMEEWVPKLFERDPLTGDWVYKFADQRPWDPLNDLLEYENDYIIRTKTRHRTPIVRTTSITNVDDNTNLSAKRKPSAHLMVRMRSSSVKVRKVGRIAATESQSGSSTPDMDVELQGSSDSSESADDAGSSHSHQTRTRQMRVALKEMIEPLEKLQKQSLDKMSGLQNQLYAIQQRLPPADAPLIQMRDLFFIGILLMVQSVMLWFFK